MLQNVSTSRKSKSSRNKNNLPYFVVVLFIIRGLPGRVWCFLGEKLRLLFFMSAERLELTRGRTQFDTAPHLKFDKFQHNKRITIKLQRCILGSLAYLCSFSWVPDLILSRRIPLLNTKLALSGMRFHLKCTHESLRAACRRPNCSQPGRGWVRLSTGKRGQSGHCHCL